MDSVVSENISMKNIIQNSSTVKADFVVFKKQKLWNKME
jgi:hypothetical protein